MSFEMVATAYAAGHVLIAAAFIWFATSFKQCIESKNFFSLFSFSALITMGAIISLYLYNAFDASLPDLEKNRLLLILFAAQAAMMISFYVIANQIKVTRNR